MLLVKRDDEIIVAPDMDETVQVGDVLVPYGGATSLRCF